MLTGQAGVLRGNARTCGAVATRTCRNLAIGNATAVDFFTQGGEVFVFGKAGLGSFSGQKSTDIAGIVFAQRGRQARHDGVGALARFVLNQLLGDVFRVLLGKFGVDGCARIAICAMARSTNSAIQSAALGSVSFGGSCGWSLASARLVAASAQVAISNRAKKVMAYRGYQYCG